MADPTPELIEIGVEHYKNLERIRLSWHPRVVLYGPNAVGKTNLLEAIGLACGSRATLWQLAARAVIPPPGSVSLLVRGQHRDLPLAPEFSLKFGSVEPRPGTPTRTDYVEDRLAGAGRFWSMLGAERGRTWNDAVWSGIVDARVAQLLVGLGERPLIRYVLESISGLEQARQCSRGGWISDEGFGIDPSEVHFTRRFSRRLALAEPPPDWLADLAADLPAAFAPFRRWLDEHPRSRYPDLLELSPAVEPPIKVVWLASERTAAEAWFDLDEAFAAAVPAADRLLWALDAMPFHIETTTSDKDHEAALHADAMWWLVNRAVFAADEILGPTMPGLNLAATSDDPAGILVERANSNSSAPAPSRSLSESNVFSTLSSGERSWLDEALAHAAAELETLTAHNQWRALALTALADEDLMDVAVQLDDEIEVGDQGFWNVADIDQAIHRLDRVLIGVEAALQLGAPPTDPELGHLIEAGNLTTWPALAELLTSRRRLRVYDEPERHLHSGAQRWVAAALDEALFDADTVIATHSHYFLGRPGWRHVHLFSTPEGVAATPFNPRDLDLTHALTREMGLSHGELLSSVRYVLFVEGATDQLVLTALFGDLLKDGGIMILPLSGVDEALSLAELELVGRVLDVGMGLLADRTRRRVLERARLPHDASKEEYALAQVRKRLRARGRELDLFGLKQPDIIAYLDEDLLRDECPRFPGWARVTSEWKAAKASGEGFKDTAARLSSRQFNRPLIVGVLGAMSTKGIAASGELARVITDVINKARANETDM